MTICVKARACLLGRIVNGEMILNDLGAVVAHAWHWLSEQYPNVDLDAFQVMPNHLHGIIIINEPRKGGSRTAPTGEPSKKPLGRLIGAFKTVSTKRINQIRNTSGIPFWQRNYHDHVIRNDADLHRIREYIRNNPLQWSLDEENPENMP